MPTKAPENVQVTPEAVATFLEENKNFFVENPDLVAHIKLPRMEQGNVTSILDFQANRLRQKLEKTQERALMFLQTSAQNAESAELIQKIALAVMRCESLSGMNACLREEIQKQLELADVRLIITEGLNAGKNNTLPAAQINQIFKDGAKVVLRTLSTPEAREMDEDYVPVHGKNEKTVASDALLLAQSSKGKPLGVLVMGSSDKTYFHEGQGTELLAFLSGVLGACLERILK